MRSWRALREWEAHRRRLRLQILQAAGLLTPPEWTVSAEQVRHTRYDRLVAEAVRLQTLPGYYIGATVYRPIDNTRRWPGVLIPHGHWKHGRVEHLPEYSVPALGVNLARQGYVAIAWDMAGYNDATQTSHDFGGWREDLWSFNPMGLQLWNSMRALDYLLSRPDVDGRHIACTGASGGATQTILLSAVDARVKYSAPVNMISAHYQGADPCEEAPGLRLGTNNVEIAAMMAPRPMLVVSCTGDWTRNTPREEFPAIREVYGLYRGRDKVANIHFDADHNYNQATREAVYRFLRRETGTPGPLVDEPIGEVHFEDLLCGGPPEGAVDREGVFAAWCASAQSATPSVFRLRRAIGCEWPQDVGSRFFGRRYGFLSRPGAGDHVPVLWFPGGHHGVVLVHEDGAEAAVETDTFEELRRQGHTILCPSVFQTGSAEVPRDRGGRWYLSYNQTDDAHRVQDILTCLKWLWTRSEGPMGLVASGRAGIWCTFAAAVADVPVEVDPPIFEGADEDYRRDFFVPGIQRAGGWQAALTLVMRQGRSRKAPGAG